MAKVHHPDKKENRAKKDGKKEGIMERITERLKPPVPEDMFVLVGNANDVLGDEASRKEYDEGLVGWLVESFPPMNGLPVGEKLMKGDIIEAQNGDLLTINEKCQLQVLRPIVEEGYRGSQIVGYEEMWNSKNEGGGNGGRCYAMLKNRARKSIVKIELVEGGKVVWEVSRQVRNGEAILGVEGGTMVIKWRGYDVFNILDVERNVWCGGGCWKKRWRGLRMGERMEGIKERVGNWWKRVRGKGKRTNRGRDLWESVGGKEEGIFEKTGEWLDDRLEEGEKVLGKLMEGLFG